MGLYTPIQNCIRIGLFIVAFVVVIVSLVHKPKIKKAFMVAIGIAVFSLFFPQWEIYKDGGTVELWSYGWLRNRLRFNQAGCPKLLSLLYFSHFGYFSSIPISRSQGNGGSAELISIPAVFLCAKTVYSLNTA